MTMPTKMLLNGHKLVLHNECVNLLSDLLFLFLPAMS